MDIPTAKQKSTTCSVDEETKTIAARLVSDILDRYCLNEKKLSDGRLLETEKVTQMLEAQKAASEAQKAASDATRLAEEARLSTLKFAFEHKLGESCFPARTGVLILFVDLTTDEPVVSKAPAPAAVPAAVPVPAPVSAQPAPAMPQTLSSLQSQPQPLSLQQMQQFQQMQQLQSMMLMYPQQAAPQFYPQPFSQANPQSVVSQQQLDSLIPLET